MTDAIRVRNQSQQIYTRALSSVWRTGSYVHDPSTWLLRYPDVEEQMLRDADVAHAVSFRRHLIAGRQWNLTPKDEESPLGDLSVTVGTALLGQIKSFTQARLNLARAFFSGSRFARIHGEPRVLTIGDGQPRTWWVPVRIEDMDKRMYRVVPERDESNKRLRAEWWRFDIPSDDFVPETQWDAAHTIRHVYQDDQGTLGHGRALREALGWWWYGKQHVYQESLQAVERHAQGMLTAKVGGLRDAGSGKPNKELIHEWTRVLENMRSRHVLAYDKEDEIEVIHGSAEGWQMLSTMREELRSSIFTLILGANLTTAANEGGSYALAEIQENSTEALVQYDRETLEETLTDDLLGCIWWRNYPNMVALGLDQEKPSFAIKQEKKLDPQERATVASTLSQMGIELSLDDVLEQTGFRKPDPDEDVIAGGMALPAGVPGQGLPPEFAALGMPSGPDEVSSPAMAPAGQAGPTGIPGQDAQDTALNGAQVQAAADLIDRVINRQMPPGTAVRMLVAMFNLAPEEAQAMVDEAAAFTPPPPPQPEPQPGEPELVNT